MTSGNLVLTGNYTNESTLAYLTSLDLRLAGHISDEDSIDYVSTLSQLDNILKQMLKLENERCIKNQSKKDTEREADKAVESTESVSHSVVKLLSRNLVTVLEQLPSKIYDLANNLLGELSLADTGSLSTSGNIACIILIDLVEMFPLQVASLVNFAAVQIHKILKKYPLSNGNLVYLLSVVLKASSKSDIDEKFSARLVKLISKTITSYSVVVGGPRNSAELVKENSLTISDAAYYISALKGILILQVQSNYQTLLEVSTSTNSGSKLKPEAIMAQQHSFQQSILSSQEKVILFCLQSQFTHVRSAMIDLLANLCINYVATGKFSATDYLIGLYPLPDMNLWNESLTSKMDSENELMLGTRKEINLLSNHDSEVIIEANLRKNLLQIGIVETFVFYVQLEMLQDRDFLSSSLTSIIDSILFKFTELDEPLHIQNNSWACTITQWSKVIEFLVHESGASSHDILARYVISQFSSQQIESAGSIHSNGNILSSSKRRESSLFGFRSSKRHTRRAAGSAVINLYKNAYQLKLVLEIVSLLLPEGVDFNSLMHTKDGEEHPEEVSDDGIESVDEDENKSTTKRTNYISDMLVSLLRNNSDYIRHYSVECLLDYTKMNPSQSNRLCLELFALVSQEFTSQSQEDMPSSVRRSPNVSLMTKLLSYSLALSAIIKQSNITLLQNSTVAKLLSFCTQNLKHNSSNGSNNAKNSACWIVLSALVTFYNDSEFVKLNSSQFLVFWKNLLTSQFVSNGLSGNTTVGDSGDIAENLKLRSFSLICLLNYISAVEVTPELSKQLQPLLIKSHKYLGFLENSIEGIGEITSLSAQAFNELEYNPNHVSNILFSTYLDNGKLSISNQLISLILYNKKLILQGFTTIAPSLKGDISSSLVISLVRVFADPKLFSRLSPIDNSKEKTKGRKTQQSPPKVLHCDHDSLYLGEEYNYNFGVTSKFVSNAQFVNEVSCRSDGAYNFDGIFYLDVPSSLEKSLARDSPSLESFEWTDIFEMASHRASSRSVIFDPASLILRNCSSDVFSTDLMTSLIDGSIEVFQLVFSGLGYKIQFSLLEQFRSSLSSKSLDPMRRKALGVNVRIALHGLLISYRQKNSTLSLELVNLFVEIFELVDDSDSALVHICADSIGLASRLLPKAKSEELFSTILNKIVNDTSPLKRGRHVLSLAKINNYCHHSFLEAYDVITQLLKDAHPVISFFALSAARILLENSLGNHKICEELLESVYSGLILGKLGDAASNVLYSNSRAKYPVTTTAVNFLKVCITSLGPSLKESSESVKSRIFQIILLIGHGIGSTSMYELITSVTILLEACQELIIFDPNLHTGFIAWFDQYSLDIVRANMKTGVGITRPTFVNMNCVFPFTTSQQLYQTGLDSIIEMTKIGVQTLSKEALSLAWISMELRPSFKLTSLIMYWMDLNSGGMWFSQLTQLFGISSRKLVGNFLDINYSQKLLPLQQQHKKKRQEANVDFADEEAQNIVGDQKDRDDKNQPITWRFRSLIYDLLIQILAEASKKPDLVANLEPKIQEIVRISFVGTTAPFISIKSKGVKLLNGALEVFGQLEDSLYPGVSILEQQQAQIISALIPCFSSDSDVTVIVNAIDVSSRFINLPRINFYSKQRILKTMIYLLEEVSSNKFLKFVHLESMAEFGKKAIQLAILNCWAELSVGFGRNSGGVAEPEFDEILKKYSKLLISLWILVLKELSNLKYNHPDSRELQLYDKYWLNFVGVLSQILEKRPSTIAEFLQDEEDGFFFVMFCQCSEALIKNQNVSQVLVSVERLVKIPGLSKTLLGDDVFEEVIDLLDRLVLTEHETEAKCQVIDIVSALFSSFAESTDVHTSREEKYLELLRVAMLPLFETFPFLRRNFNDEDPVSKLLLSKCHNEESLALAARQFSVLGQIINSFVQNLREDLAACMLFVVAKIYEFGDDSLISVTLPLLKTVVSQVRCLRTDLLGPFIRILETNGFLKAESIKKYDTITFVILITAGNIVLPESEIHAFAQKLVDGLSDAALAPTCIQSIKSLIAHSNEYDSASALVGKHILRLILAALTDEREQEDDEVTLRIRFETAFLFSNSGLVETKEKADAMFGLLIPIILDYEGKRLLSTQYWHDKLTILMNRNSESFKEVVRERLDDNQKKAAESLVKYDIQSGQDGESGEVQLKMFV